jgi:hypothetical protein
VADNSVGRTLEQIELPPGWRMVRAVHEGSPAYTRNTAALEASREWFLFLDSDVRPRGDLINDFFRESIPDDVGIVAGTVLSDESQRSLAARWADSRGMTEQAHNLDHPFKPYFLSACMLMRRTVWEELGGFLEGIFNGEDVDFCWRAQEAGWRVTLCEEATVVHLHRETVKALLSQAAVRGASATWVHRRWPEAARPARPGMLLMAQGIVVSPLMVMAGQAERAGFRLLDVASVAAEWRGTLRHNRARRWERPRGGGPDVELCCGEFPLRGDDAVAQAKRLVRDGYDVMVLAERRPDRPDLAAREIRVRYLEDETAIERGSALFRLVARCPLACLRDRSRLRSAATPLRVLASSALRLRRQQGVRVWAVSAEGAPLAERLASLAGRPCEGPHAG